MIITYFAPLADGLSAACSFEEIYGAPMQFVFAFALPLAGV